MSLSTLLNIWRDTPEIINNVAAWRTFPAKPAQIVPFPSNLHPYLVQILQTHNINALYSHQAATWERIQDGQHPVIVTGTASGKTLCYNLPVLHHFLSDPQTRALYLFPTKALAYDQMESLRALISNQKSVVSNQMIAGSRQQVAVSGQPQISNPKSQISNFQSPISNLQSLITNNQLLISTYDGDTSAAGRPSIRAHARLVLTNPDMLHTGILPHHTRWAEFFRHLRFVVIDEMHVYRGVFGSHVANVLRRLKRIAQFYGAGPQFILTSATIANPTELAGRLIEEPVALVDNDGAAKGPKHFLLYNPPVINPDLGLRRSALQESIRLSKDLLHQNVQTIVFGRARRTVEIILNYLREALPPTEGELEEGQIRAYRSGYLPRQRREIERGLRGGRVRAVVATSALELGIDIGGMGAAVLAGYPGTIAGAWQQAGRAGRQNVTSVAVLVASANPLDQFLAHHPDYFFKRSPEQALINPDNLLILLQHLRCAAFELPFEVGYSFGRVEPEQVAEFLEFLRESGELHQSGPKYFWMADKYPAEAVSLRSASPQTVRLLVNEADGSQRTIGQVDVPSAPWMVHPQAVYLHEGQSFVVESLDLDEFVAHLGHTSVDYYTEPKRETSVELVEQVAEIQVQGGFKNHGELMVTTQVVGFRTIQWFTHEHLGGGEVDLPPSQLHTTGYWLTLTPETVDTLRAKGLWSNDPNDYGPNWSIQRNRARARDGDCCQICGALEQGREHDVHHKIPFRRFESYRQANRLENLTTLCRSCHRRAETAVRMRSGLTGLATVLGHLAPLFLMCDTYDIGVHPDPQSPLAQGQPAVIIYDMVPAGVGFSERLFELHNELVVRAQELVAICPCTDGCPSCVGPAGEDGTGGKRETAAILEALTQ